MRMLMLPLQQLLWLPHQQQLISRLPIFIRILGPDLLNSAFGLVTAVRGVASLVGPPIAGFAVDYFESREAAIVLSGLSMAASAATFIAATLYSAWRDIQALNMDNGLLPD